MIVPSPMPVVASYDVHLPGFVARVSGPPDVVSIVKTVAPRTPPWARGTLETVSTHFQVRTDAPT